MADQGKASWPSIHPPPITGNPMDPNMNYYQSTSPNQQQQQQQQQQHQHYLHYQQQRPPPATFGVNNNNNPVMVQQTSPPSQQQQQSLQGPTMTSVGNYFNQHPLNDGKANYFDNLSSSNSPMRSTDLGGANPSSGDGWGDWDWNDNNITEQQQQQPPIGQRTNRLEGPPSLMGEHDSREHGPISVDDQQRRRNNDQAQVIAESFGNINISNDSSNNANNNINDVWSWGSMESQESSSEHQILSVNKANTMNRNHEDTNDKSHWEGAIDNSNLDSVEHLEKVSNTIQGPPPPPPPAEFAFENHNYNVMLNRGISPTQQHNNNRNQQQQVHSQRSQQQQQPSSSSSSASSSAISMSNSIPVSSVFMSQAKPVTMPARQYAAPPLPDSSAVVTVGESNPIQPPQGFQNNDEVVAAENAAPVATEIMMNKRSMPPSGGGMMIPPPPTNIGGVGGNVGNPFKRTSSAPQHFHANSGLISTATPMPPLPATKVPGVPEGSSLPNTEHEPENHETLSIENFSSNLAAKSGHSVPQINDERNQYLQTSHLSTEREATRQRSSAVSEGRMSTSQMATGREDGDDDHQADNDGGLLPPPGLSRLVLGEPELGISSNQRLVPGGTDAPSRSLLLPSSTLRMDERHADGEDTASDANMSISVIGSGSDSLRNQQQPTQNQSPTQAQQQQQRVVTGVENIEQRELNMDGENVNDEMPQSQQHQQQQQEQHSHNLVQPVHNQQLSQQQQQQQQQQQRSVESGQKGALGTAATANVAGSSNNPRRSDYHHHQHHQTIGPKQRKECVAPQHHSSPNEEDDSDELLMLNASAAAASTTRSRHKYESSRRTNAKHHHQQSHQSLSGRRSMDRYEDSDEDIAYSDEMDMDLYSGSEGEQSNIGREAAEEKADDSMMRRVKREQQYYYRHDRDRDRDREREQRSNRERDRDRDRDRDHDREMNYSRRSEKAEGRNSRQLESAHKGGYHRSERNNSLRHGNGSRAQHPPHSSKRSMNVYNKEDMDTSRRSQRAPDSGKRSDRSDPGADYDEYQYNRVVRSHRGERRATAESSKAMLTPSSTVDSANRRERRTKSNRETINTGAAIHENQQMDDYNSSTLGRRRRKTDKQHRDNRYRREEGHPPYDAHEYEDEYRKHSSRTGGREAAGSDIDRENTLRSAGGRHHHESRHPHPNMMGGYGYPGGGYYDPYAAYYYSQMARSNPQAYAEWYKKYYGARGMMASVASGNATGDQQSSSSSTVPAAVSGTHQETGGRTAAGGTDGRESVHSGRSSLHNEYKDRYFTQAYLTQASNEYQRHYHSHYQQQQPFSHTPRMAGDKQHQSYGANASSLLDHGEDQVNSSYQQPGGNSGFYMNMKFLNGNSNGSGAGGGGGGVIGYGTTGSGTSGSGLPSSARSQSNLSQFRSDLYPPLSATSHTSSFKSETLHNANTIATAAGSAASGFYARSDYAGSRTGAGGEPLSSSRGDPAESMQGEMQRLTPCKFLNEHTLVHFTSGVLVTLKPKYSAIGSGSSSAGGNSIVNIVKLMNIQPRDDTKKLFQSYPGPLVHGLSHKKTIIEFCEEQILIGPIIETTTIYSKQLINHNVEKYRCSYTLLWQLLILLLRQNGMVVGTDIAELLLKNQQEFPYMKYDDGRTLEKNTLNPEQNEIADDGTKETENVEHLEHENPSQELIRESGQETTKQNSMINDEEKTTEKFRNFLLYGNVNEGIDWATEHNLWGHALFLASKLDRRTHANVMMRFANKLSLNDPLQTLYQLMSGRVPCSVTCVQDEKWGDWRPHLSMILSNTTQRPELHRKSITSLGDSLFNRGDLYAAHFCYLMAQLNFGRYQDSAVNETTLQQHLPKLVLLGSSHYKHFRDFAHNEAIIMTEIYEYACSLNDEKFSLTEFQPYKFLLATRFIDYGYHLKSLMYLEQISEHIMRDPAKYEPSFIHKVYELADRLKYYDPVLEKTVDEQNLSPSQQPTPSPHEETGSLNESEQQQQTEGQKWLHSLRDLALKQQNEMLLATTLTTAATTSVGGLEAQDITSFESYQQEQQQQQQQQQIGQQIAEINRQFNELNLQYQTDNVEVTPVPMIPINSSTPNPSDIQNTLPQDLSMNSLGALNTGAADLTSRPPTAPASTVASATLVNEMPSNHPYSEQYTAPNQQPPTQQQQQYSYLGGLSDPNNPPQMETYDYWQQSNALAREEKNARPMITMPCTRNYDTDEEQNVQQTSPRDQQGGTTTANSSEESTVSSRRLDSDDHREAEGDVQFHGKTMKKDGKGAQRSHGPSQQSSGWFGGIWNKFSLKPKNQMILPDDKNPTIVWDPQRKQWVNTDADEGEASESLKPPPKLSEIMPRQQQQQQQQPVPQLPLLHTEPLQSSATPHGAYGGGDLQPQYVPPSSVSSNLMATATTTKVPTLQSNMFKMQRNRTLKNSYVDVFNPSGAPVNQAANTIMAPAVPPPVMVPQSNFLVPDGAAPSMQQQQQQQQQYQPPGAGSQMPQFYSPN